jgi:hypothetical protein
MNGLKRSIINEMLDMSFTVKYDMANLYEKTNLDE